MPRLPQLSIAEFFKKEIAGGAVLFGAALAAIFAANTVVLKDLYAHFQHLPVGLLIGETRFSLSLAHLVNDGFMAIFFFLVGMEIKRELLTGELSSRTRAMLPAFAALGGMILPAIIYAFINWDNAEALHGWAIPVATDIAFSLGVLSLLGTRVPLSIKVFLTAVAVIDDLGAIAIIAIFYTDQLHFGALAAAAMVIFVLFLLNQRGVRNITPYMVGFLILWGCMIQSGVHATLAGVAVAFTIPLRLADSKDRPPPLVELEHRIHGTVIFLIMPLFAFMNAGVDFSQLSPGLLIDPVPLGIILGLTIGKTVGISCSVWLAVKSGFGEMPSGCGWLGILGVALLCGIGFTVSLFIGNLSFTDTQIINLVKIGVLFGSTAAAIGGFLVLRFLAFRDQ